MAHTIVRKPRGTILASLDHIRRGRAKHGDDFGELTTRVELGDVWVVACEEGVAFHELPHLLTPLAWLYFYLIFGRRNRPKVCFCLRIHPEIPYDELEELLLFLDDQGLRPKFHAAFSRVQDRFEGDKGNETNDETH